MGVRADAEQNDIEPRNLTVIRGPSLRSHLIGVVLRGILRARRAVRALDCMNMPRVDTDLIKEC